MDTPLADRLSSLAELDLAELLVLLKASGGRQPPALQLLTPLVITAHVTETGT